MEGTGSHCGQSVEEDSCMQCGLCCRVFGCNVSPTPENIHSWIVGGRGEILRYFSACRSDGTWVSCEDLDPRDTGGIVAVEMRDPETGSFLPVCPFLRRTGKSRYTCAIHEEKPDMCRNYMPWIFGETYFPRCRALAKREEETAWSRIR